MPAAGQSLLKQLSSIHHMPVCQSDNGMVQYVWPIVATKSANITISVCRQQ